jgi:hypothetical protein
MLYYSHANYITGSRTMKTGKNSTDRRQHRRANVQGLVIGVLNSGEPVTIGAIADISLGGVKFTDELRMVPNYDPIRTIDLLSNSYCLADFPCKSVWKSNGGDEASSPNNVSRQSGIQFGELTPDQIFLLKSLISGYTSLHSKGLTPDLQVSYG